MPAIPQPSSAQTDAGGESSADHRKQLWLMVLAGLGLRLMVMTAGHTYRFPANNDHFSFGWETGRLARSLATGHGFSSPFHGETGPSAWIAPLYPYFLALVFKLFGVYSNASAFVALAVNSLCSVLTSVPLFLIGEEIFGVTVALWSGWIWALLPYAMYWAIRFAWETSFATLMLALGFLLAIRLARENSLRRWLLFGLVWALIALSNPSILAFLPLCGSWIVYRQHREKILRRRWVIYSGALFVALIAPWMARNYQVFGKIIFIRGNFGAELRMGNGPGADGQWMSWFHPSVDTEQFRLYREMGEPAYVRMRGEQALQWMEQNPRRFSEITLKRIFFYWFGTPRSEPGMMFYARNLVYSLSSVLAFVGLGLALARHGRAAYLFLWLMLSLPLVYYITFTHPRYRVPMEPEMLLLMVFAFVAAGKQRAVRAQGGRSGMTRVDRIG